MRGALSSLFSFSFSAGLLLEYLVGPYVSFGSLIMVSCVAPVLFFISSPCIPESPYFHIQQDLEFKAFNNLMWLRKGVPDDVVVEEVKTIKVS